MNWGSLNNPERFVKIWFDAGGRVDVNFFHVSVPDIEVFSALPDDGSFDHNSGGPEYDLSEQQLISCDDSMGGCASGGTVRALEFWRDEGPMEETCAGERSARDIF